MNGTSDILNVLKCRLAAVPQEQRSARCLHGLVGDSVMSAIRQRWDGDTAAAQKGRQALYLSAEFLLGRLVSNNLLGLGVLEEVRDLFRTEGLDYGLLEEPEDPALGNGGLGRLAACYLDSAATLGLPLDGYGIRYRYGLFRQEIQEGFQREEADDWQRWGDPWSVRREEDAVEVSFSNQTVRAVPYDMPVIGPAGRIGRLRLWQSEPVTPFDFGTYQKKGFTAAFAPGNRAEELNALLYPEDGDRAGKLLRLSQQYFFSSASLQDAIRSHRYCHGGDLTGFARYHAIQLNDTHPVSAIPELIRLLMVEGLSFDSAFSIAAETFAYTNHTVMPEALEAWGAPLYRSLLPQVYPVIQAIDARLTGELKARGLSQKQREPYRILQGGRIHMARLAAYVCHHTNGVSNIHTEILKAQVLEPWHRLYPQRFLAITNGVTQRRWLQLCNPGLSRLITELLGTDGWSTNLTLLGGLAPFADDGAAVDRFAAIKRQNKEAFSRWLLDRHGLRLDPAMLFDVQIKRLHEYKRQFLNILGVLDLYFSIRDGELKDFAPTAFLFGGKAAPGYVRAKGVIKLIGEVSRLIAADPAAARLLQVIFVPDYNVSVAERLIPAAQLSEQISPAGTEASGTGNLKLALNGALTVGTWDGANIEIFQDAGAENNYLFGARVEELRRIRSEYDPERLYRDNPRVHRVLDALTDGTLDDGGSGVFAELRDSLLKGASWHDPDQYFLLLEFDTYREARLRANSDYRDPAAFARKGFLNTAGSGNFSSDQAVLRYARQVWGLSGLSESIVKGDG